MNGSEDSCVRNVPCLATIVERLFWRVVGGGLVCSTSVREENVQSCAQIVCGNAKIIFLSRLTIAKQSGFIGEFKK